MSAYVGRTCPYCQFPLKPGDDLRVCGQCGMPHHADCWNENGGCTTYGCPEAPTWRASAADEGFPGPEGERAEPAWWQAEQLEADQGAEPAPGQSAPWPTAQPQSASGERALLPLGLALAGVVILAVSLLALASYREKAVRDIEERLQAYRSAAAVSLLSEDVGKDLLSRISAYDAMISSLEAYVSALAAAEKTIESWWPHLPTDRRKLDDIRCEREGIQAVLDALYTKRSKAEERLEQERQVEEERRRRQAEILYRLWLYEQEMSQSRGRLDIAEDGGDQDAERDPDSYGYLDPDSTAENHSENSQADGYGGTLPDHLSPGW